LLEELQHDSVTSLVLFIVLPVIATKGLGAPVLSLGATEYVLNIRGGKRPSQLAAISGGYRQIAREQRFRR
jgi:hypothetical protein